ncbi:MAG TPA: IPT/TIG domain-containing protein [Bacteroidales bacterium]
MQKRKSVFYLGLSLLLTITLINLSCKKDGNGPNISSITPSNVTTGQEITIEGSNLSNSSVMMGGVSTAVTSNTSTSIVTTVPAASPLGSLEVMVTNSEGSASGNITVTAVGAGPVITSISPSSVAIGGQITITGTGLKNVGVSIATKAATIISSTDTSVTVIIPDGIAKGQAAVLVYNLLGEMTSSVIII